jgi:SNF2 family DNA or RNA helicase
MTAYLRMDPDRPRLVLEVEYPSERTKALGIAGSTQRKNKNLFGLPLKMESCWQARSVFGSSLKVEGFVSDWARNELAKLDHLSVLAASEDAELPLLVEKNAPRIAEAARDYQRVGVRWLVEAGGGLLAFVPRLGKSMTALGAFAASPEFPAGGQRFAVFAGRRAVDKVWRKEINRWLPEAKVFVAKGSRSAREKTILEWSKVRPEPSFLVTLYETARVTETLGEYAKVEAWTAQYPTLFRVPLDGVILDETHKIMRNLTRTKGSMASRGLLHLNIKPGAMKIGLSGTPMPNRPQGLFGTLNWIAPEKFTSFWTWADTFFEVDKGGYGWTIVGLSEEREQMFYRQNSLYILRRTRQEVVRDDKPTEYIDVWCTMGDAQRKLYTEMTDDAETSTGVTAVNILSEILRLKQFAFGEFGVAHSNGKPKPYGESCKTDELLAVFDELEITSRTGGKAIVGTQFKEIAEFVVDRLSEAGITSYLLTGDTSDKRFSEIERHFQHEPDDSTRVLVMTTQTGGASLDLYAAESVHQLDELWNPDENLQLHERAYIPGKSKPVQVFRYYTSGSVDEAILRLVSEKDREHGRVLDGSRGVELLRKIARWKKEEQ